MSEAARTSAESPGERLGRWCRLRQHLKANGFNMTDAEAADLLRAPTKPTTRPDIRLVAYCEEVKIKSRAPADPSAYIGRTSILLAAGAYAISILTFRLSLDEALRQSGSAGLLWWGVVVWAFAPVVLVVINYGIQLGHETRPYKGFLALTLEGVSLPMRDRKLHVAWQDVSTVYVEDNKKELRIVVETIDGFGANLDMPDSYVSDRPMLDELVALMRDLIVARRRQHYGF